MSSHFSKERGRERGREGRREEGREGVRAARANIFKRDIARQLYRHQK